MPILDIFSRRQKQMMQKDPDPLRYDLPRELRVQIAKHILNDALGHPIGYDRTGYGGRVIIGEMMPFWELIRNAMKREHGVENYNSCDNACEEYTYAILQEETERAIDLIECAFRLIDNVMRKKGELRRQERLIEPDAAIEELNERFAQHSVGYRYEDGRIIKMDSDYLHNQVVSPALRLLHQHGFQSAEQEFLNAHEHYRSGKYVDAVDNALKAFESTMKIICDQRGWKYDAKTTAKPLIDVCVRNNLLPSELTEPLKGLSTLRNLMGGHGKGSKQQNIDPHYAAYALHLAGTNIVLFVQAHKSLK